MKCLKTFSEFFAGIGLMRLALEREGWKAVFANDIDPAKEEMYKANFPDAGSHFLLGDIHHVSPTILPTTALATASFPCNDLSLAGTRSGLEGRNSSAFWGFVDLLSGLKERKPPVVLIENVPGFLTSRQGGDFRKALEALNKLGYAVDAFLLDAACFVPQSRQRLFVVGTLPPLRLPPSPRLRRTSRRDGSEVACPKREDQFRPPRLAEFIEGHPEIDWRIRPLPQIPRASRRLDDILEDLPEEAPGWWSPTRAAYLLSQMNPRHRQVAEGMIHQRKWSYGTVFRRVRAGRSTAELRVDGLAGCLRTPRGGSARQILFKAGFGRYQARLLTPRECARLMGADEFKITVPKTQALFGFGDAVCVPVIRWIARHYLNPLLEGH